MEQKRSCLSWAGVCRFVAAFVLVFAGSLFLAGWQGWFRYSKFSANEYEISVVLEDGRTIELAAGEDLRVLKSTNRVNIENEEKKTRTLIYNPKEVTIRPK